MNDAKPFTPGESVEPSEGVGSPAQPLGAAATKQAANAAITAARPRGVQRRSGATASAMRIFMAASIETPGLYVISIRENLYQDKHLISAGSRRA
ncbi:MAG: hypothetical protein AAFY08_06470 [Planctomycetota bacterium]